MIDLSAVVNVNVFALFYGVAFVGAFVLAGLFWLGVYLMGR